VVNVIFGGIAQDESKQKQKLNLYEILSVKPSVPTYLKWLETPISYLLVLDPVVVGARLTRTLIDGGSGLNILFAKTLKKMGLDITNLLKPMDSPFYGNVPSNAVVPLGQVMRPVTFGTEANYRTKYLRFEVADFDSSYHAIFGRPAIAKFMAVPHYTYLVLKMSGPHGVLYLNGDLKTSYDCDAEAVTIASELQQLSQAPLVAMAAKKLSPEELEIPMKKSASLVMPPRGL